MTKALVLVVDDDRVILESLNDFLLLHDYSVLTAATGAEALSLLKRHKPMIIVSDIMMPDMDGYEFHQAIRQDQRWATIPFLFLTAKGTRSDVLRGTLEGVDAYVTKPFEPETLLKVLEARLQRAADIEAIVQEAISETRGLLLNVFSHELRTPLTIIHGYVDLLSSGNIELTSGKLDQITSSLRESTNRLVNLVQGLLLISTLESGMGQLIFEDGLEIVNLEEICRVVLAKYTEEAARRSITIELDVSSRSYLRTYPPYLSECLSQLIENSIRFNVDNGHVWIEVHDLAGVAEIRIKDEGIGIPPAEINHIFERFHQVDRETNEQQGVGIGLTTASAIVKLHHGTIEIESEPGIGSTFIVKLPKEREGSSQPSQEEIQIGEIV